MSTPDTKNVDTEAIPDPGREQEDVRNQVASLRTRVAELERRIKEIEETLADGAA